MGKSKKELKIRKRLVVLFLLITMLVSAGCKKKMTLQDYLDLGDKYLLELNYEEAVVAFTKAIELEPRDPNAYLKLANVYDAQEDYEKAVQILAQGYEATGDEEVKRQKEIYENLLSHEDLIQETLSRARSADRESFWQLQSTDEYQSFVTKLDRVIKRDGGDGKWLLIYPCGHCYYGGMADGKRSGYGIWSAYDYEEGLMEYASGSWQDDYPNGNGEVWSVCIPIPEDLFYYKVNLKDGLYHGVVQEECVGYETIIYECSDGIPVEVQDLHPEDHHRKDWYCYYSDENGSSYTPRGNKKGILHAGKGWDNENSMKNYTEEELQNAKESIEAEKQEWENITGGMDSEGTGEYEFGM